MGPPLDLYEYYPTWCKHLHPFTGHFRGIRLITGGVAPEFSPGTPRPEHAPHYLSIHWPLISLDLLLVAARRPTDRYIISIWMIDYPT